MRVFTPSERKVIRFAVGSEDAPTSFVWRLYTQGEDAYLNLIALPNSNFVLKFSMHGSRWQHDVDHRRLDFEAEACPDSPGWMRGPVIMFCHLPHVPTLTPDWLTFGRDIKWFPMPNEWELAEFAVYVTDADWQDSPPPPSHHADEEDPSEPLLIGPLPLRDGRKVWLRYSVQPIPDDRRENLLNVRESLRGATLIRRQVS